MILSKLSCGALLLSTLAFAPLIDIKFETVPSDLNNGMVCDIGGANHGPMTVVEFQPRIGGFSFGTSGVMRVPLGSQDVLSFSSYYLDHNVYPNIPIGATWDSWVLSPVGSGDIGYFSL